MTMAIQRFKDVLEVFGPEKFSQPFLELAHNRTKDLTSDEMRELCNLLIENCERAPSMPKIVGFAALVRAKKRAAIPHTYNSSEKFIACRECDDLGVVRTQHEKLGDLIMRCRNLRCKPSYYWTLPRWADEYEKTFKKSKCPIEWFKPEIGESRQKKINEWKSFIQLSTKKFLDAGFVCEYSPGVGVNFDA